MADASLHLNAEEYGKFIHDHRSELTLVDFYADWCPHCRSVGPILEGIARSYKAKKVNVVKIDTEKDGALATQYNVEYLPTIVMMKDEKELDRLIGGQSAPALEEFVRKYLR